MPQQIGSMQLATQQCEHLADLMVKDNFLEQLFEKFNMW